MTSRCPYATCVGTIMTNFDHSIEPDAVDKLAGEHYGLHAAWNFNARVWFDKEARVYKSEVWRYGAPGRVLEADSLQALMEAVNDDCGWD